MVPLKNLLTQYFNEWQNIQNLPRTDQTYETSKNLLIKVIKDKNITDENLALFILNCDIDPQKNSGFAVSQLVVKALQQTRHSSSMKEFFENLYKQPVAAPNEKKPAQHPAAAPAVEKPIQPKKPETFMLKTNPRPSKSENIEITVTIVNCSEFKGLTYDQLGDFFKLVNEHTLNKKYHCQNTSKMIAGKMVHRPNHNGTHSARQVRCLEAICDCINNSGNLSARQMLVSFSSEEMLHLKLAAYFMRSGRVDEFGHDEDYPDNYHERSAQIYEAYAKQLTDNLEVISFTRKLIQYSCVPWSKCVAIHKDNKAQLGHSIVSSVHELDLIRCYPPSQVDAIIPSTKSRLNRSGITSSQVDNLYNFSRNLLTATGAFSVYYAAKGENAGGNAKLFAECSLDGKKCWEQVSNVPLPSTW